MVAWLVISNVCILVKGLKLTHGLGPFLSNSSPLPNLSLSLMVKGHMGREGRDVGTLVYLNSYPYTKFSEKYAAPKNLQRD
jgi:hypothetical protein